LTSTLMLTVLLQSSTFAAASTSEYAEAYRVSAETGKPLMILVGADWCPACQQMKSAVIPELRRNGELARVAFAQVNTDRDSRLAQRLMSGGSIPQLILYYKSTGEWKRVQVTGAVSARRVETMIDQGVEAADTASAKTQMATMTQ